MAKGKPVSSFYILDDNIHVEFDATLEATVSESASISSHPLQDGTNVADHVIKNNTIITLSGIVNSIKSTAFKTKESFDSPSQVFQLLRSFRSSGKQLSVVITQELPIFTSAVITSLSLSQDNEERNTVRSQDGEVLASSWNIDITFENFQKAESPRSTIISIPNPNFGNANKVGTSAGSDFGEATKEPVYTALIEGTTAITTYNFRRGER